MTAWCSVHLDEKIREKDSVLVVSACWINYQMKRGWWWWRVCVVFDVERWKSWENCVTSLQPGRRQRIELCRKKFSQLARKCNGWSVWCGWCNMTITCHRWAVCLRRPAIRALYGHLPLLIARLSILIGHRRQESVVIHLHWASKILRREVNQVNAIRPRSSKSTAEARRIVCLRSHLGVKQRGREKKKQNANKLSWEHSVWRHNILSKKREIQN